MIKKRRLARWSGAASWAKRESRAGDRLPYARHLDDRTLLLRDGSVMRMIRVPGLPFETDDSEMLDHHLNVRETMLRSILDARFALYHHVIRRRVHVALGGEFAGSFAEFVNNRWQDRLDDRRLFINEQVLTIVRRPARGKTGLIDRLHRRGRTHSDDVPELRELDAACTALVAALEPYGARMLGVYERRDARYSEPLEMLSAIYNGELRSALLPEDGIDLGHHIPYNRVSFGIDAIETRGPDRRRVAGMLSVKDYPDCTRAGLIDNILRLPHELVLTETFVPTDRQIARERIDLSLRRLRSADEEAGAERREMIGARDMLGAGQTGFGDHHLSLLIRADSLDELETALAEGSAALSDIGAVSVREDINLEPCFWGQFPGNESYLVRRALISTANAAGFLSLHGLPMGRAAANHWGDCVSVLETTASTPYFFNFHEGDLGHFTVIGPSGSGKTVVLNFMACQAQRFAPRTILFDKDRGSEIFIRAAGGTYSRLVPGEPSGLNPLQIPDTPVNRAFLRDWLGILLDANGPEEEAQIAHAIDACFEADPAFRRLRHFHELLGGSKRPAPGDLASRLQPWINGEHGWLFDNPDDRLDLDACTAGFDMTALLDSPRLRTPALMYLFHRIDERLDGSPSMILIDEGWKALDDEVFARRIRDWLKTLRKRNAVVGFATQSAHDALASRISAALVEQTATMIFTPNPKAREEDYCIGFGLSRHELQLIRSLPAHSRCFLVRHANHSVVARLDLSGMPEIVKVLSGREESVRKLDHLRATLGDDPLDWLPPLAGIALPGHGEHWLEAAE